MVLKSFIYSDFSRSFKIEGLGSVYDELKTAFNNVIEDFQKIVGWTEQEVEEIDLRLEDYEGYIMWSKEDVEVGDGA